VSFTLSDEGVSPTERPSSKMNAMTLQIESNLNAPSVTRSRLQGLKPRLEPRFDDVILVVSELVSNSVRHGRRDSIDVKISSTDGVIRVEVTDQGPGFAMGDPRGEGLGLAIVEKLSERWGLKDGRSGFTVWAELSSSPMG
jgi:anti-sigma regulatory factor (Ser/Thr protein kinase)